MSKPCFLSLRHFFHASSSPRFAKWWLNSTFLPLIRTTCLFFVVSNWGGRGDCGLAFWSSFSCFSVLVSASPWDWDPTSASKSDLESGRKVKPVNREAYSRKDSELSAWAMLSFQMSISERTSFVTFSSLAFCLASLIISLHSSLNAASTSLYSLPSFMNSRFVWEGGTWSMWTSPTILDIVGCSPIPILS